MKTLYFECSMGATGNMLMAALYDICEQKENFLQTMNQLFSPDLRLTPLHAVKKGVMGTQLQVTAAKTKEELPSFFNRIDAFTLPDTVKENINAICQLITTAKATVHGTTQIPFYEAITLNDLVDIVGCTYLIYLLAPDSICCSPIHVGSGFVPCKQGILPVPTPATAELLKGIPFYTGSISSELCTVTGAAILRFFASHFCPMPVLEISATGYGLGAKDFSILNCVRTFLGEPYEHSSSQDKDSKSHSDFTSDDQVLEISCNLDDMTGEAIGFATEFLMDAGALDVYTIPVQMKKNRPGILFVCFCKPADKEKFTKLIFSHTTTRGMRYQYYDRAKLESVTTYTDTPYGKIRIKKSSGYDVEHAKPEFEDVKAAALKHQVPLSVIYDSIYKN